MRISFADYTAIRPLRYTPAFLQHAHELADITGDVPSAVTVLFRSANITVNVVGDTVSWSQPGVGTLFVGDHRDRAEVAPLLALFGHYGRNDVHLVAKPFSTTARALQSFGHLAEDMVLPVIPRTLARDRDNIWNRDLGWRLKGRSGLLTLDELARTNAGTIQHAAELISQGHLVNLYPAGGVMDASLHPWQRGLGTIIQSLPDDTAAATQLVLFRFDDFSTMRIIRSLMLRSHGLTPKPYEVTLRIGPHGTLPELLGDIDAMRRFSATELTNRLRQQYVTHFGGRPISR